MRRVLVMANSSRLVDVVASILAVEIGPDVLQLVYHLPRNLYEIVRDPRSVLIIVDEGETNGDSINIPKSFRNEGPLLMIKASLPNMNLDLFQGYQLTRPGMEQVIELVQEFLRSHFKKKEELNVSLLSPLLLKT